MVERPMKSTEANSQVFSEGVSKALAVLKPEDHKKYGQTIISLFELLSEPHWVPGTLGFVNKFHARRIIMISRHYKSLAGINRIMQNFRYSQEQIARHYIILANTTIADNAKENKG